MLAPSQEPGEMNLVYIITMRSILDNHNFFVVCYIFLKLQSEFFAHKTKRFTSKFPLKFHFFFYFNRVSRSPMINQRSILMKTIPAIRDVTTARRRRRTDNAFIFDCCIKCR